MKKRRILRFTLLIAFFIAVLAFFFYEITFQGKTFKVTTMFAQSMPYGPYGQMLNHDMSFCPMMFKDSASLEEPFYQFLKINFQKRIFPLWNPHQFCGTPLGLMMEAGVFFPLNILVYALPNSISFDALIFARILLAGLLMYWLMSVWKFHWLARIAAAFSFMLSGPMVVGQLWTVNTEIVLPLLILSVYKAYQHSHLKHFLLFSFAVGLSIFSGHGEHIFLTHFFAGAYIIFLVVQKKNIPEGGRLKVIRNLFLFYSLGVGLSSVILFPFFADFLKAWTPHTSATGLVVLESKAKIITMLVPTFFKKGFVSVYDERFCWAGGYLGVVIVLLLILGLGLKTKKRLVWFFAIFVFLVFGKMFGLFYAQWIGYLPIFNMILLTWHLFHILSFLVAFLVGAGIQSLIENPSGSLRRITVTVAGIAVFILVHLWFYRLADFAGQALQSSVIAFIILGLAFAWALSAKVRILKGKKPWTAFGFVVLMIAELFIYAPRYRPKRFDSFPRVPYIDFLKEAQKDSDFRAKGLFLTFYKNTPMAYGIDGFDGHQSIYPHRYVRFAERLVVPGFYPLMGVQSADNAVEKRYVNFLMNSDILALANVRYFVFPKQNKLIKEPLYDKEVKIGNFLAAAPRAYLVYNWIFENKGDEEEVLRLLKEVRTQAVSRVIIEKDLSDSFLGPENPDSGVILPARITRKWANGVIVEANPSQPCFLILLDAYYPGWKAWVDGKRVKIYPANYLFRAVYLEPGKHTINFRFIPFWFYFGLGMTFVSFSIWIILYIKSFKNEQKVSL